MSAAVLPSRNALGLSIVLWGLGLGILGDLVLRTVPLGLNLALWVLALVAAGLWLVRHFRLPASADFPWLALSVVLCAIAFVRRDSNPLQLLDVGAVVGLLSLTALASQGAPIRLRGASAYVVATCVACAYAWFGALRLLFGDIAWGEIEGRGRWRQLGAVAVGLIVALPLLLIFGGLFVSADAAFESLVQSFRFDPATLIGHLFFTGVFGALAAGALRGACMGQPETAAVGERCARPNLPFTSTITALGALALLFAVFVAVQIRWLFGGATVVAETTGLTMAEYARRGFFELVTAAALVLPILLVADWTTRRDTRRAETAFRTLALLLVLMVGVMLASALQRMLLYVQAFGLTELRLYTTAFMVWLGGVFAWFAWTVLRGARPRFAFGALVHAMVVLGALHVANPDALITRVNTTRTTGMAFDASYAAGVLSADAVPVLLDELPRLAPEQRDAVARRLLERWGQVSGRDWRSWNWSESRARALVQGHAAELAALRVEPGDVRAR
jgi:hypothetical protein